MRIVVCIKQTPASTNIPVDRATGGLRTEGLTYAVNPLDEYAVEEALRLKERLPGSSVFVLSAGPARAEEAVRSALAMGCDEGAVIGDPSFEGSDPTATAYLLSAGVREVARRKGAVGLVLCGKQTSDRESGQVGPSLGAWLDWPGVVAVRKISEISEQRAVVERMLEDGSDTIELDLPAVLSVVKEINEPRLPSLKGKMAARRAAIGRWGAAELSVRADVVGAASWTAEVRTAAPPPRGAGAKISGATPEEKAADLVQRLKELKYL